VGQTTVATPPARPSFTSRYRAVCRHLGVVVVQRLLPAAVCLSRLQSPTSSWVLQFPLLAHSESGEHSCRVYVLPLAVRLSHAILHVEADDDIRLHAVYAV